MTTSPASPNENELSALTRLAENVIKATRQIIVLYQPPHFALNPEDFIRLYCRFLTFIVEQKLTGDKVHLYQLMVESIQKNTDHGKHLRHLISQHTHKDPVSIRELVKNYGVVTVPVVKLIQFMTQAIQEIIHPLPLCTDEDRTPWDLKIEAPMVEIFDHTYQLTLQEINALQMDNPLIFLLEYFSTTVGWLAGFFADLSHQTPHAFLEKSLLYFRQAIQLESSNSREILH